MQPVPAAGFDIAAEGHEFIEAPRLSPEGDLWFADLTLGTVHRRRPGHATETMLEGRQWVGGIVFDESGLVLCAGRGGIVALDPETGALREVLSEIEGQPVIAVNDMEADGRGGLFAGTLDFVSIFETGEKPAPGLFFHLSASGDVTVLRRDVAASNGIAASACGRWLYHSETLRGIWRYPLDAAGRPGTSELPGELLVELEDSDGIAVDRDGNVWVACWQSGRLLHLSPEGTPIAALTFPYPHVVSVDFGAADPATLHVSTGGNAAVPGAGAVLRLPVAVPGLAGPRTRLASLSG